jgi:hypothetical protein
MVTEITTIFHPCTFGHKNARLILVMGKMKYANHKRSYGAQ